jgi:hypothetical protein
MLIELTTYNLPTYTIRLDEYYCEYLYFTKVTDNKYGTKSKSTLQQQTVNLIKLLNQYRNLATVCFFSLYCNPPLLSQKKII